MKKATGLLLGAVLASLAFTAQARDTQLKLSIQEAMSSPEAEKVLDPSIKVSFASGGGKIVKQGLVSNKKTNAVGKSDEKACQWAFLSAVKQFQDSAKASGASRVVNLVSYYKRNTFSSTKEYECHVGAVIAGVALKGDLAN
ncbi:excinuclease ABC subunit A [Neisseria arctica]|uniref:Excinuclease ABC subunit A n=1 Tax=Neisseria arctica TaxID=1470200 RepID=A0A0J0YQG1_9NEIS|nr:hypothetical protein [Neisseria arctica]KLT72367.1 excinuclease ABC subunit A [Neisseria arctica]UOO85954.1 excinuclease ATPase subunit [Neisseria arctica]